VIAVNLFRVIILIPTVDSIFLILDLMYQPYWILHYNMYIIFFLLNRFVVTPLPFRSNNCPTDSFGNILFCRQDYHYCGTVSDQNVRTRIGYNVYAAHTDLREHSVLLLHEEMDDTKENDGIKNV